MMKELERKTEEVMRSFKGVVDHEQAQEALFLCDLNLDAAFQ